MDIYTPTSPSDRILENFLPTRLAIKKLAGKFYFCKSTKQDFIKYIGSGTYWRRMAKKYGKENIETLWISDWYYCPYEIQEVALAFSRENQIVESELWANLVPENGLQGSIQTKETIQKAKDTRNKNGTHQSSEVVLEKIKKSLSGRKFTESHKSSLKNNHADFRGPLHPRSNIYVVTSPLGEVTTLHGTIEKFCKENGLSTTSLKKISKGQRPKSGTSMGWLVEEITVR